jgi:hypothetical protein
VTTVVLSAFNVTRYVRAGGHLWVYLQYADALRRLGCRVVWLEDVHAIKDPAARDRSMATLIERLSSYGLDGSVILYDGGSPDERRSPPYEVLTMEPAAAEAIFRSADLLLNLDYRIGAELLSRFRRTAVLDIDPGLLQYWMSSGQLVLQPHDVYLTTGETVGTPGARFPDCGLRWHHVPPGVSLDLWPYVGDRPGEAFTTVSSWWSSEWVEADGRWFDNTKRAAFLRFVDLPQLVDGPFELALALGGGSDLQDRELLERSGWRVRRAQDVTGTPADYRAYIQASMGELSCAKATCRRFENAWVSDRTLCYLASGRPVIVEDTGPSAVLPDGLGMFRFTTVEDVRDAVSSIRGEYARHSRAARDLAAGYFDAKASVARILDLTGACAP